MRKILSLFMSICMVAVLAIPVFAGTTEFNRHQTEKQVTNEYFDVMELKSMTNDELSKVGLDSKEISMVRNSQDVFDQHIKSLKELPVDNLMLAGYNADQIRLIKMSDSYKYTDVERVALSATCTTTVTIDQYTGTKGRVHSKFKWSGIPAYKMTDILITAWNNWQITGKVSQITYASINATKPTYLKSPTLKIPDSGLTSYGVGYSYPAGENDNYYYAKEGYAIFVLKRQTKSHLETACRVAHKKITGSLEFTIRGGLDISLGTAYTKLGTGHATAS